MRSVEEDLERSELKRAQLEQMVKLQAKRISQLESIILTVRNAVLPRPVLSSEQERIGE